MDLAKLENHLQAWMNTPYWYKAHPSDEERFYLALKSVFEALGTEFHAEHFKEAMIALAKKNDQATDHFINVIDRLAIKAGAIAEYLHATGC